MRFVPSLMESSIEPEASSTNTMSSGVVDVDATFEVPERAESTVTNAELSHLTTSPSLVVTESADTVLSVHIRPILEVLAPRPLDPSTPTRVAQSFMVEGSTDAVLFRS